MITSILALLSGGNELKLGIVLIYIAIASMANIAIYLIVKQKSIRSTAPVLTVEMDNWFINMMVTLSIAASFVLVMLLQDSVLSLITRYIDQIIVIVVLINMPVSVNAIRSGFSELLLIGIDESHYQSIKKPTLDSLTSFPPENQKFYILKIGRRY